MGKHKQMDRLCFSKKPHKVGSSKAAAGYSETLPTNDQTEWCFSPEKDSLRSRFTCTIIIISIQPLGQFEQEPEPSQATGIALVRCILDKFLGVVCHCFPPYIHTPTIIKKANNRYVPLRHYFL